MSSYYWASPLWNGLAQLQTASHSFAIHYTNGVALRQMARCNVEWYSVVYTHSRNFFWDHSLEELRHQAQLGNQAFWWHINNSSLTFRDWLKCNWRGIGKGTFLLLAREKSNGKLSIIPFFCNFREKEYYLISLRSVHIRISCLWLKYAFFVNSKHYSRSNRTKGNSKP